MKVFLRLDQFRGWEAIATDEFQNEVRLVGPFMEFEECLRALAQREGKRLHIEVHIG